MAPKAADARARDEESQGGVEKPLPGQWNKGITPEVAGGGPVG